MQQDARSPLARSVPAHPRADPGAVLSIRRTHRTSHGALRRVGARLVDHRLRPVRAAGSGCHPARAFLAGQHRRRRSARLLGRTRRVLDRNVRRLPARLLARRARASVPQHGPRRRRPRPLWRLGAGPVSRGARTRRGFRAVCRIHPHAARPLSLDHGAVQPRHLARLRWRRRLLRAPGVVSVGVCRSDRGARGGIGAWRRL